MLTNVGDPCQTYTGSWTGGTTSGQTIVFDTPFPVSGNVVFVCIYCNHQVFEAASEICAMFYRPTTTASGTITYLYLGESQTITNLSDVASPVSFRCDTPIAVQPNDVFGVYMNIHTEMRSDPTNLGRHAEWGQGKLTSSYVVFPNKQDTEGEDPELVWYVTDFSDVFVRTTSGGSDTYNGLYPLTAKKTFGAAYGVMDNAGTIHVLNSGADMSSETIPFTKSMSILGTNNFFMPEFS